MDNGGSATCGCGEPAIAELGGLWVCKTHAYPKIYENFSLLKYYHPRAQGKRRETEVLMGIRNTVEIRCDYPKCSLGANDKPVCVSWSAEDVQSGLTPIPEEAKRFVTLELNGNKLAFCGRLHAAKFFLPETYEIVPQKIVEFPSPVNGQEGY